MQIKKFWRNIHLYLSIVAGLIFFVECLTGCLLVFEEEITELTYPNRFYVNDSGAPRLPIDALAASLSTQIKPTEKLADFHIFSNPRRTVEVSLKKKDKGNKTEASTPKKSRKGAGDLLYVNPYTGQIQARVQPSTDNFFKTTLKIHQTLLLNAVGKTILGVSTFVVFVIIITGLILWWPKHRGMLKNRLKVKTQGNWKRLNHDLHVVLGFYCSFFLIIFLVTSLPWSFKWANAALYSITNSKPTEREEIKLAERTANGGPILSWQKMLELAQSRFPESPSWRINYQSGVPKDVVEISSVSTSVPHRNGFDQLAIDPFSGKILKESRHEQSPGGWQLRRYMKPIHTGAIGGLPTKIIAFAVCLIASTFPITGFVLWINRYRKSKNRKKAIY